MKPRNWTALIVASAALVVVTAAFFDTSARPFTFGSSSTTPLEDLSREPVLDALGQDNPDFIVYLDSNAGWFMVANPQRLQNVEIGIYRTRLFDTLLGDHSPSYCSGRRNEGRHIWAIKDASIQKQIAFCNPRRMDLEALAPFGQPVTYVDDLVNRTDARALMEKIEGEDSYYPVRLPHRFEAYEMRKDIALPAIWTERNGENVHYQQNWDEKITAIVQRQVPAATGEYALDFKLRYARDYGPPIIEADGNHTLGPTASGVRIDGKGFVFEPGFSIYTPVATFHCDPDICAALDAVDLSELSTPFRDFDILDRASTQPRALSVVHDQMPDLADIRAGQQVNAPAKPILYDVQYVITGQSTQLTDEGTAD